VRSYFAMYYAPDAASPFSEEPIPGFASEKVRYYLPKKAQFIAAMNENPGFFATHLGDLHTFFEERLRKN
jgi:hypothetical protein